MTDEKEKIEIGGVTIYEGDLTELLDDPENPNEGKVYGEKVLRSSINKTGLGRGVLVDKDDRLVAGNKARAAAVNEGFTKAIVIETDGNTMVVTKRRDMDLKDEDPDNIARMASYFDNQAALEGISFDPDVLRANLNRGMSFEEIFQDWQITEILSDADGAEAPDGFEEFDEDTDTDYCCPKCGYEWAGKAK